MKIIIAGGDTNAEYLIKLYKKNKKNEVIVINPDAVSADRLSDACHIKVWHREPWSRIALEGANAFDADVFIALCKKDTDNLVSCLLAKRIFNAKKTICVVDDPKNVDYFKALGVDSVISSTYLLAQSVMSESSVESLTKTLSIDNDKVIVVEKTILSKYAICGRFIKDIRFPKYASIACIYRQVQIIIPSGSVMIEPKDTLVMITAPANANALVRYIETERADTPAPVLRPKVAPAPTPAKPAPTSAPAKPAPAPAAPKKPEPEPAPKKPEPAPVVEAPKAVKKSKAEPEKPAEKPAEKPRKTAAKKKK